MPDFDRTNEPSLEDIRASDAFIDALSAGTPPPAADPADTELADLLGGWRDQMRWPPDTGLITEEQAVAALNAGLADRPARVVRERERRDSAPARNRRGLSVVGAAAAAVLCIGGFGAVVAGAGPGDALYGLRTMIFGAPKQVRDDQVALAARTEMQQVQELISQGDWQQAQEKLVAVSTQVASIGDQEQKQELLDQFNDLSAKVVERDPEATAAPGITYTVPPSATELVPAVAPPSESSAATSTEGSASTTAGTTAGTTVGTTAGTTAGSTPSSASPSAASTTPTSAAPVTTTAATSSAPSSAKTSSSAPASSSSSSAPASSSASPAQATSSAPATTSASTVATTSVAATTTSAPSATATPTTTTAPAPAAASTTPTATTATAATTTATAATTTATAASTTAAATPQPVTTTTTVPVATAAG